MARDPTDLALVARVITESLPGVEVFDTNLKSARIRKSTTRALRPYTFWKWKINNASLGGAQCCLRNVHLRIKNNAPIREQIPPHFYV